MTGSLAVGRWPETVDGWRLTGSLAVGRRQLTGSLAVGR